MERPPREDFPENHAERVEVAPSIDGLPAGLLGGHVPELALEDALLFREEACARDAEVGDFHRAFEGEQDVLRADVAVDDLERLPCLVFLLVRVVEALGRFGHDPRAEPRRDVGPLRARHAHQAAEIAAFDELHREEQAVVAEVLELVDLYDVRVIEARREVGLFDEHRPEPPRAAVRRQDPLEDEDLERPLRAALLREKHLRHPAGAETADDLELRDLLGRGGCGGLGSHQNPRFSRRAARPV